MIKLKYIYWNIYITYIQNIYKMQKKNKTKKILAINKHTKKIAILFFSKQFEEFNRIIVI